MTHVRTVATPGGEARLHYDRVIGRAAPRATVVLGHGAGGGVEARDLAMLAVALPRAGYEVIRVEQPWRVSGRRVAVPPAQLDLAWDQCIRPVLDGSSGAPLIVGGRSAGARVAFRSVARGTAGTPVGVLALSFPLFSNRRRDRTRRHEISGSSPALVIQGTRDPLGAPADFVGIPDGVEIATIPGADHQLRLRRGGLLTQAEADDLIVTCCRRWLWDLTSGGIVRTATMLRRS